MRNYKKLNKIYAKIPDIDCKGLCYQTCTVIPAAKIEIQRAKSRLGGKNPFSPSKNMKELKELPAEISFCIALKEGRCSIYNARPAMCRVYGVAEGIECAFGCKPKKKLTKKEFFSIMQEIEDL